MTARRLGRTAARAARVAPILAATLAGAACSPGPIGVASLPTDSLSSGLLAHWTFDEGLGLNVGDSSGNNRNGTIFGGSWSWEAQGKFGGALHFGGSDQVTVQAFPQATPSFSVSAWLLFSLADLGPATSSLGALLSNETTAGGWAVYLAQPPPPGTTAASHDFVYFLGPQPGEYAHVECNCSTFDQWHHIATVVDAPAGTLTLYVDGTVQAMMDVPHGILPGQTTLFLGRWPNPVTGPSRFLSGALDDVAIWARALAPEEIGLLGTAPAPSRI